VKALTVKQPWAWAIVSGGKDVENRSRPTKYRGQIYIHAGKSRDSEALKFPAFRKLDLDFDTTGATDQGIDLSGMVIGTVDLVDCHHADDCREQHFNYLDGHWITRCSEWAMPRHYHWVLANPRPLACPFPEKGKLGIWNLGPGAMTTYIVPTSSRPIVLEDLHPHGQPALADPELKRSPHSETTTSPAEADQGLADAGGRRLRWPRLKVGKSLPHWFDAELRRGHLGSSERRVIHRPVPRTLERKALGTATVVRGSAR
jgi:hypothetical protein